MKALRQPATIIALLALFVALGGGAAIAGGLISGKQIVDHSIPTRKLTDAAIKTLRGHTGPAGPQGTTGAAGPVGSQGPKGDTGASGPTGPSNGYSVSCSSSLALGVGYTTVASLALPAGSYALVANTTLYMPSGAGTSCKLMDGSGNVLDTDTTSSGIAHFYAAQSLFAPLTTKASSTVSMTCGSNENDADATDTRLMAIKLGSVTGS